VNINAHALETTRPGADLAQRREETVSIRVIREDQLAPVTAMHDVVDRVGILDSQPARHARNVACATSCINTKN
jgi:hypothetical protein